MVQLFVDGKPVGTLADAEKLLPGMVGTSRRPVEFRDAAGGLLGVFTPAIPAEPLIPWEPDVTQDEIDRRLAEPGLTFEEIQQKWEGS